MDFVFYCLSGIYSDLSVSLSAATYPFRRGFSEAVFEYPPYLTEGGYGEEKM